MESKDPVAAVEDGPTRQQKRRRAILRALNGAGIGTVLGAILGALLGAGFAVMVDLSSEVRYSRAGEVPMLGALFGVFPGGFAGFWIGMTAVCRRGSDGVLLGTVVGTAIGIAYALLLGRIAQSVIGLAIVASGLLGGLALSSLIRVIRARWKWWSRWEE